MYSRILVALDFRDTSDHVLDEALRAVKDKSDLLVLCCVLQVPAELVADGDPVDNARWLSRARERCERLLNEYAQRAADARVPFKKVLMASAESVADALLRQARVDGVDALFMGRGRGDSGGGGATTLGSTAERVLRNAHCHVVLVRDRHMPAPHAVAHTPSAKAAAAAAGEPNTAERAVLNATATKHVSLLPTDAADAHALLAHTTLRSTLPRHASLVTLERSDSVKRAYQVLTMHHVYGAPVVDDEQRYAGYVDILDVVNFTAAEVRADTRIFEGSDAAHNAGRLLASRAFASTTVGELLAHETCARHPRAPLVADATLLDAVRAMIDARCLRNAIVDSAESRRVVGTASLHRFLRDLAPHAALFAATLERPLEQLRARGALKTCRRDAIVLDAFRTMIKEQVNALAVVDDDNNAVVATLSLSDLKLMGYDRHLYDMLHKSVGDFLSAHGERAHRPAHVAVVDLKRPTRDAVDVMVERHINQVFLAADGGADLAAPRMHVVAIADVLDAMLEQATGAKK